MGRGIRWCIAATISLVVFGAVWAVLAQVETLDPGARVGLASVPFALILAVLGAWAERVRESSPSGSPRSSADAPRTVPTTLLAPSSSTTSTPSSDPVLRSDERGLDALISDIVECHARGRPVWIETASVEEGTYLSSKLKKHGVPHEVLSGRQDPRKRAIIAEAGRKGAVTIATDGASRYVDVVLGGDATAIAAARMELDNYRWRWPSPKATWPAVFDATKGAINAEHDEVVELGGLCVLRT